jgi:hypothetical protein
MNKLIDDRGRAARLARRRRRPLEVPDGGGPERSILDGCDLRTAAGNEASRNGSAVRTSKLFMSGPLGSQLTMTKVVLFKSGAKGGQEGP